MASLRNLFVVSFLSGTVAFGADSSLLTLVMPDAQVLCGANVERILKSEIGKEIGSQIQGKLPELQQAIQKTGFDPAKDLKEVLIAATGKGKNGPAWFWSAARSIPTKSAPPRQHGADAPGLSRGADPR